MQGLKTTDQQLDDAIKERIYQRIAEGKPSAEIAAEFGVSSASVAAYRAHRTMRHRTGALIGSDDQGPESDEVEDAFVTTFGLERDLQRTLRENITQLEPGLKIIGEQHHCAAGFIDLLCKDDQGALVVVELKAGEAKDAALGQVLGYMGAIKREMTADGEYAGRPVRGITVAKEFSDRVRHAALAVSDLRLVSYAVRFTFIDQNLE
jgi:hypothetical protein